MLAAAIPHARIMVCEYESKWFGKGAINQRLNLVGEQLIRNLSKLRSVSYCTLLLLNWLSSDYMTHHSSREDQSRQ